MQSTLYKNVLTALNRALNKSENVNDRETYANAIEDICYLETCEQETNKVIKDALEWYAAEPNSETEKFSIHDDKGQWLISLRVWGERARKALEKIA